MSNLVMRLRLRVAFGELRKDGILAEECLACCTTCATHELGEKINKEKALGGVYWHSQDEDGFRQYGPPLMIGFVDGSASGEEVARRAVLAFKEAGLEAKWDGSAGTKIEVDMPKEKKK